MLEREAVKVHVISKLITNLCKFYPLFGAQGFQLTGRELAETQYPMASSSDAFNQSPQDCPDGGADCSAKISLFKNPPHGIEDVSFL
jgi:hypothetical protein